MPRSPPLLRSKLPPVGETDALERVDGRRERSIRRRLALIEAALALFMEKGYRRTTVDAIIAKAGGSRETIYEAFGGKLGLFGAIVSNFTERLITLIDDPEAVRLPPREGLTRLGTELMAFWASKESHAVHRIVLSEGWDVPEIRDMWYRSGIGFSLGRITKYLATQHECGRIDAPEQGVVARQFLLLLMGEMAISVLGDSVTPADPEASIRRTVDLILRAHAPGAHTPENQATENQATENQASGT